MRYAVAFMVEPLLQPFPIMCEGAEEEHAVRAEVRVNDRLLCLKCAEAYMLQKTKEFATIVLVDVRTFQTRARERVTVKINP